MFKCSHCGASFVSRNALFAHLRAIDSACYLKAKKDGMSDSPANYFQRLAVVLAFEGLGYYGFQHQRGYPTIEGCLFAGRTCTHETNPHFLCIYDFFDSLSPQGHSKSCARTLRTNQVSPVLLAQISMSLHQAWLSLSTVWEAFAQKPLNRSRESTMRAWWQVRKRCDFSTPCFLQTCRFCISPGVQPVSTRDETVRGGATNTLCR